MNGNEKKSVRVRAILKVNLTVLWTVLRFLLVVLIFRGAHTVPEFFAQRIPNALAWWLLCQFLFLYAGITIAFWRGDLFLRDRAKREKNGSWLCFLFRTPGFFVGLVGAIAVVWLFPSECAVTSLDTLLPIGDAFIPSLLILLYAFFWEGAAVLLARRFWLTVRGKRKRAFPMWETGRFYINLACCWLFFAAFLPWILTELFAGELSFRFTWTVLRLFVVILAIVLAVRLFRWLRARRKRKKFLRELESVCKAKEFEVSSLKKGTRHLFGDVPFLFTLKARGKTYSCAVYACINYRLPLYIYGNGMAAYRHAVKIRKAEMFHWFVRFPCYVEGEGEKLLIFNPVPATMYLSDGGRNYPADTGDRAGDAFIYSASGFLGALERDTLCQRAR